MDLQRVEALFSMASTLYCSLVALRFVAFSIEVSAILWILASDSGSFRAMLLNEVSSFEFDPVIEGERSRICDSFFVVFVPVKIK